MFYASFTSGCKQSQPVGKVVCVGRNYAEHARELNNPVPSAPLWFIKPASCIVPMHDDIVIPADRGSCHHEIEVAILIGSRLRRCDEAAARAAIIGVGLALDLTLRDLQSTLKEKGHPWEVAKSFDGSCVLSEFVPATQIADLQAIEFSLTVNGDVRQHGMTSAQIFPILELLQRASRHFTLEPGDVLLTGTPAGVAALQAGDQLHAEIPGLISCDCRVSLDNVLPDEEC